MYENDVNADVRATSMRRQLLKDLQLGVVTTDSLDLSPGVINYKFIILFCILVFLTKLVYTSFLYYTSYHTLQYELVCFRGQTYHWKGLRTVNLSPMVSIVRQVQLFQKLTLNTWSRSLHLLLIALSIRPRRFLTSLIRLSLTVGRCRLCFFL